MKIKICELTKDGLQTRVALDERTVAEYADAMRDGDTFPPVKVFCDAESGCHWLADGFHRVEAATRAGLTAIEADVSAGGFIDALRWALGCNAKHGKRVTNEDKQNALQMAWDNRQQLFGGDPSGALLAETCGVHRNTASAFVAEHIQQPPAVTAPVRRPKSANDGRQVAQFVQPQRPVRTVVGTDGKQYPVRPVRPAAAKAATRPAGMLDCNGREIPRNLIPIFQNVDQCKEVEQMISKVRCTIKNALGQKADGAKCFATNPVFSAYRQEILINLDNAYNFAKSARPYCVCPICDGFGGGTGGNDGCKACHGRGWQTEDEYERNPKEFKA